MRVEVRAAGRRSAMEPLILHTTTTTGPQTLEDHGPSMGHNALKA